MEKVKLELEVSKETYEVGKAFETLIKNYKIAAADGFQATQDIPAVLLGSMGDLLKALEGANNVGVEFSTDLGASINGALIPISNGLQLLLKK